MLAAEAWEKVFDLPQIAIVGGLAIGCLVPIAGIISSYWFKVQKVRSENALKRTMVERGMSVDEIERVIAAQGLEPRDPRR